MDSQDNTLTKLVQQAIKTLTIRMAPTEHRPSQKCTHDNRVMTWASIVRRVIEDHNAKCDQNQWYVDEINLIVTAKMPDSSYVSIPIDYQRDGGQKEVESKSASESKVVKSEVNFDPGKPEDELSDIEEKISFQNNVKMEEGEGTEMKANVNQYSGKASNTETLGIPYEAQSDSSKPNLEPNVKNEITTLNKDSNTFPCQKCDKVCTTLTGFKANSQTHQEPKALFPCPICPMVCKKQHFLDRHMTVHNNKKEHKCEDCAEAFKYPAELKVHRQKEHGINVTPKCHACGALFKDADVLTNHLWRNHQIGDEDSDDDTSDDEEDTDMMCCPHCNDKFATEDNLKVHVESHGPLNRHKCDICGWRFMQMKMLQQHLEKHDANKETLMCRFCKEIYDKAVDLNEHLKTHSNEEVIDPKQCKVCKKTFYKVSTKKKHELRHFQPPEKHDCILCDKSFPYAFYLRRHMQAHVKSNKCSLCGELFRFEVELIRHRRDVHQITGNFVCDVCGKSYTTKSHLNDHMNTHTGKRVYLCDICGKSFLHRAVHVSHMKQHRDVANRGTVPCTYCPKRFQSQKRLKAHVRNIHLQDKKHACQYCEKKYATSFALKAHEQTHTGDYEFKCPYCPKQFPSKKQYIHHERTHTGERPHECEICQKKFTQKSVRNRHMRDVHHDSDKPRERFECATCGAVLGSKLTLQQHEKRHVGVKNYSCDTCGAAFMFNCDLIRHLRIHTDGKPYRCDQCYMSFAKRADLSRHCMVHGNQPQDQAQGGANSLMNLQDDTVVFHLQ